MKNDADRRMANEQREDGSAESAASDRSTATAAEPHGATMLTDEELDEVIGGVSTNWEIDW